MRLISTRVDGIPCPPAAPPPATATATATAAAGHGHRGTWKGRKVEAGREGRGRHLWQWTRRPGGRPRKLGGRGKMAKRMTQPWRPALRREHHSDRANHLADGRQRCVASGPLDYSPALRRPKRDRNSERCRYLTCAPPCFAISTAHSRHASRGDGHGIRPPRASGRR